MLAVMTGSAPNFNHNEIIYSISEVSHALKRMVEDHFGVVKLRGEISGWKLHSSGHGYFTLKDEDACMDAVCWRGSLGKLRFKPEDGLEVVATGKLTTYPGRSKYQIVVDSMEPAGAGALMALLEKRRKELEAEGLFAATRKRKIPYMPCRVGVITSPTGAVIRDILHRITDRFPTHVVVWPVAVQGEGAAEQVAAAIEGFNAMHTDHCPDVLIVARGGGSLEDLWAFNEEIVVRAAANSRIPLISAVGHETDTTLIDFASDKRAPTPTAAAEMAVPVLADLLAVTSQLDARLKNAALRHLTECAGKLQGLLRGLPRPAQLLQVATQRLDDIAERLSNALPVSLAKKEQQLYKLLQGLNPRLLQKEIAHEATRLSHLIQRHTTLVENLLSRKSEKLASLALMLESVNVQRVLERGFALVRGDAGALITHAGDAKKQKTIELQFADGRVTTKPL